MKNLLFQVTLFTKRVKYPRHKESQQKSRMRLRSRRLPTYGVIKFWFFNAYYKLYDISIERYDIVYVLGH